MDPNRNYPALLGSYHAYRDRRHPLDVLGVTQDPYPVFCGVCMSGHTTDVAVNAILPAFLVRFPNPQAVVGATREEMIPYMRGIAHNGLKSDYIRSWAAYLLRCHGQIDNTIEALTKLPGLGRKTAGLVLYHVLGVDAGFPLDTHCLRVLKRLGWGAPAAKPKALERELLQHFPVGTRYQAYTILTHHGRSTCVVNQPQCQTCLLRPHCTFGLAHSP